MSTAEAARHRRDCIRAGVPTGRNRAEVEPLPWPRSADDGTPLGVDLAARAREVKAIMLAKFPCPPKGMVWEDYYQEVCATILRRNRLPSAHDPRKSSFGHYVWLMASNVGANMAKSSRNRVHLSTDVPLFAGEEDPWISRIPGEPNDWETVDALLDLRRLSVLGAVGPSAAEFAARTLVGMDSGHGGLRRAAVEARGSFIAQIAGAAR